MIFERKNIVNRILSVFVAGFIIFTLVACLNKEGKASTTDEKHGLTLSDSEVKITSMGHMATFRLYDTVAAKEFYDQLPLKLDLTNFLDAQWMFYPPKKLSVTSREAYHDGKKGELSYYEPWGDVFMLYKDFYAGDNMHRLGINLTGIEEIEKMSGKATIEKKETKATKDRTAPVIHVTANGKTTVFQLNNSPAARDLFTQLPLNIKVKNYSHNEKIFYPPKKLSTDGTPKANAKAGTLAYYAPWGDVVMFFKDFGSASGLYELGYAVSGSEYIQGMSGTIQIKRSDAP
ncbi:MAG TPA: cyclophilin-like fold protein [Methanoregulaceae archaeon]|nr:cyclophilin-like fold protein [Bacteroidales bacterium]HQM56731.1 cyclophilin-like fold protein [Methanoregulaceae archaeon]